MLAVSPVSTALLLLPYKEFKLRLVAGNVNAPAEAMSSKLNQLPVVIVGVEAPVIFKLGLLVTEPPVVPNTNVCVAGIADVNPALP